MEKKKIECYRLCLPHSPRDGSPSTTTMILKLNLTNLLASRSWGGQREPAKVLIHVERENFCRLLLLGRWRRRRLYCYSLYLPHSSREMAVLQPKPWLWNSSQKFVLLASLSWEDSYGYWIGLLLWSVGLNSNLFHTNLTVEKRWFWEWIKKGRLFFFFKGRKTWDY